MVEPKCEAKQFDFRAHDLNHYIPLLPDICIECHPLWDCCSSDEFIVYFVGYSVLSGTFSFNKYHNPVRQENYSLYRGKETRLRGSDLSKAT